MVDLQNPASGNPGPNHVDAGGTMTHSITKPKFRGLIPYGAGRSPWRLLRLNGREKMTNYARLGKTVFLVGVSLAAAVPPWSGSTSLVGEALAQDAGPPSVAERALGSSEVRGKRVSTATAVQSFAAPAPGAITEVPYGAEFSPEQLEQLKSAIESALPAESQLAGSAADGDPSEVAAAPGVGPSAPTPVSNFTGFAYTGWIPPDPIMAAGPSDLIVAVNSSWRIYSKTGVQLFDTTLSSWFANVLPANSAGISVFDPWVIYDQLSNRFVLLALAKRDSDQFSRFLVAVSGNSTAIGGWCNWSFNASVNGSITTSNWADYTKVGVTNNAVVLSANMFNFPPSQSFQYAKLRFLSKSQIYNTSCPGVSWWDFWDLRNADNTKAFTVQPAHSYILSSTSYGINSYSGGGDKLTLWRYTTPATIPPAPGLVRTATLGVAAYTLPPNAVQRGSATRINTGDARLLDAIYRGSGLWTTHTVGCSWPGDTTTRSCIRWYQISPAATTGLIRQQRSYGAARLHYYYPGIVANAVGDAVIVFNRSGPSQFANIRYTGRRSTDPVNTLQGSALLHAGQGCYVRLDTVNRNRWGDYNGIAVDPSSSLRTWIFSEYAFGTSTTCGNNVWRTHVGQVGW